MNSSLIGWRLRKLRSGRPIKDVSIACGVGISTISQYESGLRIPIDSVKLKLAEYYGKSVQELFYDDENEFEKNERRHRTN